MGGEACAGPHISQAAKLGFQPSHSSLEVCGLTSKLSAPQLPLSGRIRVVWVRA